MNPQPTEMTGEDALQLIRKFGALKKLPREFMKNVIGQSVAEMEVADDPPLHYSGSVHHDGNFLAGPEPVIISGDLVVKGFVKDTVGDDTTLLCVLGDLRAENLLVLSQVIVLGNVEVQNVVYGNSLGDLTLHVGGDLKAKALIKDGHHFSIVGKLDVQHLVDGGAGHVTSAGKVVSSAQSVQDVMSPEVLDGDTIDLKLISQHIRQGKPVLKADARQVTRSSVYLSAVTTPSQPDRQDGMQARRPHHNNH